MNFSRGRVREEPEINFIPLIDVLLVILIFLFATTSYAKFSELQIKLPNATANPSDPRNAPLNVAVDAQGRYLINSQPVSFNQPEAFSLELKKAAGTQEDPVIIISADAQASHQSVINVMEAARLAGYVRITFATQHSK
jgi:biopolymer transport protein ExbD